MEMLGQSPLPSSRVIYSKYAAELQQREACGKCILGTGEGSERILFCEGREEVIRASHPEEVATCLCLSRLSLGVLFLL